LGTAVGAGGALRQSPADTQMSARKKDARSARMRAMFCLNAMY
jgi:hypothetical protein